MAGLHGEEILIEIPSHILIPSANVAQGMKLYCDFSLAIYSREKQLN